MLAEDVQSLVDELQVRQMELELQNEELRETQIDLAESRDRYSNLYEFAPVGYVTVDRDGVILQANLRAADMLAIDRQNLIGRPLADFVDRRGQDQWHLQQQAIWGAAKEQACEVPLRTLPGRLLWVRLESTASSSIGGSASRRHIALVDITQRIQAGEANRDSHDRLRRAAAAAQFGSYSYDFESGTLIGSPELFDLYGLPPGEEIDPQHIESFVHSDDRGRFRDFLRSAIESLTEEYDGEFRIVRPDGQVRWISDRGKVTYAGHGEDRHPLRAVGMAIDITDRKRAEEKLRDVNETLEMQVSQRTAVLRLLQDVTRVANEARTVPAAMQAALERISQYNGWQVGHVWQAAEDGSGDMVSTNIWHMTEDADLAVGQLKEFQRISAETRFSPGQPLIGAVAQTGEPVWIDDISACSNWLRGDATSLELHATIAFPVTVHGEVVAVLEFFSDHPAHRDERFMEIMPDVGIQLGHVVKREKVESSLHESEERLRAVLEAAPDAVISTNSRGVITDANLASERIFGYAKDEMIGQNVKMLIPPPFREMHDGFIARYLETRQPRIIGVGREVVAQCKSGRIFPIRINLNEIDHMDLFVGIVHDISTEKELEKQVVDAAAEEQRRIGQDIHDGVGQELTGLRYMAQTHAETLAGQSSPDAKTAERMTQWLETVQQQLRAIIRELVPVEVDQQGLLTALRGLAERTHDVHDLSCSFECDQPITVADAALGTHLYRIAQEAVRNAVRHAQAAHIWIRLSEAEGVLKMQVSDDGVGIKIASEKGAGVGLRSMAYRAGLVGATLDCRPGEGRGTVVTCTVWGGNGGEWRLPDRD